MQSAQVEGQEAQNVKKQKQKQKPVNIILVYTKKLVRRILKDCSI